MKKMEKIGSGLLKIAVIVGIVFWVLYILNIQVLDKNSNFYNYYALKQFMTAFEYFVNIAFLLSITWSILYIIVVVVTVLKEMYDEENTLKNKSKLASVPLSKSLKTLEEDNQKLFSQLVDEQNLSVSLENKFKNLEEQIRAKLKQARKMQRHYKACHNNAWFKYKDALKDIEALVRENQGLKSQLHDLMENVQVPKNTTDLQEKNNHLLKKVSVLTSENKLLKKIIKKDERKIKSLSCKVRELKKVVTKRKHSNTNKVVANKKYVQ